jgi:hypothetical protein
LLQHASPSSKFADPYSILPTALFGKLEWFASFNLTQAARKRILESNSSINYGVLGPPLISEEITHVIPGIFHQLCRLILNTLKWTLITAQLKSPDSPLLKELIKTLTEEGIKLNDNVSYFQVTGNSGKKCSRILNQITLILNFFPEHIKECMKMLWKECAWLCYFLSKQCPEPSEVNEYYYHALTYTYLMVTLFCEDSITVTIRTILDHNLYWIFQFGSLGIFVEEMMEANNAFQKNFYCITHQ